MSLTRSKLISQSPNRYQEEGQPADISGLQHKNKISASFGRQLQMNAALVSEETYAIVNSILRSTINFNSCKICENRVQLNQFACFGNCSHKFCLQCLIQYCLYKIKVNEDVFCPQQGCKQKLTEDHIIYKHLPEQMQQRFKEHLLWKKSLQNPNIKLCPNEKCVGGQVDLLKNPPQCGKCFAKYCKECIMAYHEGQCDRNFQEHFKQWKRCPKCKVFIQKNQGCNKITCRCSHEFCFVCLADWQKSHYECLEENDRLFFKGVQSMTKRQAFFNLVGVIFALPLVLLYIPLIIVFGAVVALIVALLAVLIIGGACIKDCKEVFKFIGLLVLIPLLMIIVSILAVLFSVLGITIPLSKIFLRRYGKTVKFLTQQLMKKQNKQPIVASDTMMQQL